MDHVLSGISGFSLFTLFSLFSFWPSNKKAKATDITEYMFQSNYTRLYRLRFNQSNMESSSNKSSEKHKIRHNWLKFFLQIQKRRNILTNCVLICVFQTISRKGFHFRLVKMQPVQACGVGLDHVLSYVSCFGLFVGRPKTKKA